MPRRTGGALGAVAAGIILIAGQAAPLRAALSWDLSLGAGAELNDNLHLDPETPAEEGLRQPVEETIFTVSPGLSVLWGAPHDRLQLRYAGEYSIFRGDEERESFWVHNVTADASWRRWSPFFLEAREERSRVPRTQEREGEASVDRIDRNLISLRAGLFSELGSRSSFELAYRGEWETYTAGGGTGSSEPAASPEVGTPVDTAAEALDRVGRQYVEALVHHRWSPLWSGEVRASYGQVDRRLAPGFAELRASAAVDQRWSEQLGLRYHLEWRRETDEQPAEEAAEEAAEPLDRVRTNLLVGAGIRGGLAGGGSWSIGYQDGLADQPDGDTLRTGRASAATTLRARLGSTLDLGVWYENRDFRVSGREEAAWGPTLSARWMIAPAAALDVGGAWISTTIRQEALAEVEDRTTGVAAGFVLLLARRFQLEVGYGYRTNDSTDALRSYRNNRAFALLTFHFQPVAAGRLPPSFASGLVSGGTPSGGTAQAAGGPAVARGAR